VVFGDSEVFSGARWTMTEFRVVMEVV